MRASVIEQMFKLFYNKWMARRRHVYNAQTMEAKTVWDAVAVLTLLDAVHEKGHVSGNLMLQKLGFLAELEATRKRIRAARFRFFRFTMGPYSAQLANTVEGLISGGVLKRGMSLTSRGRYVLDYAADSIRRSDAATQAVSLLRETGRRYGKKSGADLKDYVYGLTVPVADFGGREMVVRDIANCVDILDPARDETLQDVAPFDDDTLDELASEIEMPDEVLDQKSPAFHKTIQDALRRAANACS